MRKPYEIEVRPLTRDWWPGTTHDLRTELERIQLQKTRRGRKRRAAKVGKKSAKKAAKKATPQVPAGEKSGEPSSS